MIMTFRRSALAAAATVATIATSASAQPVNASATGRANVLEQISATNTSDLDFGTIVVGTSAATVTVNSANARSCGAGLTCSGTPTAPGWLITATPNRTIYWNGTSTITVASGTDTMTINLLNLNSIHNMPASGSDTIRIGAVLNVGANQADGNYSGTFNVDFSYF